jgi:hypothetical protein
MSGWREYRFWSVQTSGPAVRLSVSDGRGEYFVLVARGPAREWRARREELLDVLATAMRSGHPGEVRVDGYD